MLARQLDGVAVLVSRSRYLAGPARRASPRLHGARARRRVSAFRAAARRRHRGRSAAADLERPVTLPSGRLREPLDAAAAADAFVALDDDGPCEAGARRTVGRPIWRARPRGTARRGSADAAGDAASRPSARTGRWRSPASRIRRASSPDLRARRLDDRRASCRIAIIIGTRPPTSRGSPAPRARPARAPVADDREGSGPAAAVPAVSACRWPACR